jgi:energy-coupling factor transporter ATP-binding protein EcfA2
MPETDGIEIPATMKSLALLFEPIATGKREPTAPYLDWFLIKLNGLLPFASPQTVQVIEQICAQIKTAQEKFQKKNTDNEFYAAAGETLELMNQVLLSASSSSLEQRFAIPYPRHPFFTGRDALLSHLRSLMQKGRCIALTGEAGIGKTQLALEYAFRYRDEYQVIFWIDASLFLSGERNSLVAHLNAIPSEQQWLVVLDQVEDLTLPGSIVSGRSQNGSVLLTTRTPFLPQHEANALTVPPLSEEEAVLLLLRRARIIAPQASLDQVPVAVVRDAVAIAQQLKGVPLAVSVAGGHIESGHVSLSDYLHLLNPENQPLE